MARAGYCSECRANVWLNEAGGCSAGHEPSCISAVYDPVPTASSADIHPQSVSKRTTRTLWWALALTALVIVVGLGLTAVILVPRLARGTTEVADEWKQRLAADYPGWRAVGFNVQTFQGSQGSETTYRFVLVPPDSDLSVPVIYVSKDGEAPVSQDEVMRPDGRFNTRSASLLEYIDRNYSGPGKSIVAVESDQSGAVTVEWVKVKQFGPFSSRYGSYDELHFNEASGKWESYQPY